MADARGFKCSKSNFWKFIRNPVYCGLVTLSSEPDINQVIKGVHVPIISESLFYEVQDIISSGKKTNSKSEDLNAMFFLKGYLTCPFCNRRIRGSFSQGKAKKYPYYHCFSRCKVRISARLLNENYSKKLQQLMLSKKAIELFEFILEEVNIDLKKVEYLEKRNLLFKQLEEQEIMISRVRKLFVSGKLKFDDFAALKNEYLAIVESLNKERNSVNLKLGSINELSKLESKSFNDIFKNFEILDTPDKKEIVSLFPPQRVNFQTGALFIEPESAISKILLKRK